MIEGEFDIITFDCYGTLIDWEDGIVQAFRSEAGRDGVALTPAEIVSAYMSEEPAVESRRYQSYRSVLAESALRAAGRVGWQINPDRASFLERSLPSWRPFLDTNPALELLAKRFKLGILSNIDDDLLAETRKHITVDFELIITAEQVGSYKPGHAHFKEALARAGDKRILHAAQSYFHDVVPARSLGIPVVWVNRRQETAPTSGPEPNAEVGSLRELAEMFGLSD